MRIDTFDNWNPLNPINQKELPELTELEEAQEYNLELKTKLKTAKKQISELMEVAQQFENQFIYEQLKKIRL